MRHKPAAQCRVIQNGLVVLALLFPLPVESPSAFALPSKDTATISEVSCPQDFESFTYRLLTEIPAYANRVNTRAGNPHLSVLLATRADFQPLPFPQVSSTPTTISDASDSVRQVFFTTLLKRISSVTVVYQQEHHWLFMAPSDRGWEFVQLYSRLESYPSSSVKSAPRNSSEGSLATAIRDWLKTCHYRSKGKMS